MDNRPPAIDTKVQITSIIGWLSNYLLFKNTGNVFTNTGNTYKNAGNQYFLY